MKRKFSKKDDTVVLKNWHYLIVCKQKYFTKAMRDLLLNPDRCMQGDMLKLETKFIDTTTVATTEVDKRKIVIKRYNIKNFLHFAKRSLTTSRAKRCWHNVHHLIAANIPTPNPIAFIEKRFGPIKRQAYFIYEYIEGELANQFFLNNNNDLKAYVKKYSCLLNKMFAAKISHGDMNYTNFLVCKDNIYFIDLDGMRKHKFPWTFNKAKRKDILRFLKNWDNQPEMKKMFMDVMQS